MVSKWKPASVKVAAITEYFGGNYGSIRELGKKYGVTHVTIINWVKTKDRILQECQDSAKLFSGNGLVTVKPIEIPCLEDIVPREKSPEVLLAENKILHKKLEYLADRVAYLESLAKLMGLNPQEVVKNGSKPSTSPSQNRDDVT